MTNRRDDERADDAGTRRGPTQDEAITPDDVTAGGPTGSSSTPPGDDGFGLDDLDRLARRAVDAVLHLVRRATALAGGVLLFVVVASIGGFLLGLAALDGGIRTVWIALGGFFGVVAIGSILTAMLRLRAVKNGAGELVGEVRALIGGDRRTERTVTETVRSAERKSDDGIVQLSREFFSIKGAIGGRVGQFRQLATAMTAITTFPGLVAIATLIAFVFAGLALVFLLALAL